MRHKAQIFLLSIVMAVQLVGCSQLSFGLPQDNSVQATTSETIYTLDNLPPYQDVPYVPLQGNIPDFPESDVTTQAFETYAPLDELERCGVAYANICTQLMPTSDREDIGQVKPTGWHSVTYDVVEGRYLYNRCHLIGFQLAGENDNEQNLITGTRYFNVDGMLPFENQVAEYVQQTDHHVLYRVTPVYQNNNLVASGVQIEAYSVEDRGEGVCFNVYVYNVQPGVVIDYETGESWLQETVTDAEHEAIQYILNTNSMKFHLPSCASVEDIGKSNRQDYQGTREQLLEDGYVPCGICHP